MGFFLWGHRGSGDHGSEDRVRGTCALLGSGEVFTTSPEEDWRYGLGHLAPLRRQLPGERGAPGNCCLALHSGPCCGGKQVLWDWSGEPCRAMAAYDLITAPDRRSLSALQGEGLGKNARLGPDPLFLVERQLRSGCRCFRGITVGLCPGMACWDHQRQEGLLYAGFRRLIQRILEQTSWNIALIPYRVKPRQNDLPLQRLLAAGFEDSGRIFLRPDGSSPELRGDLSLCEGVIGSPAAVMAAWSCGVPALCLGYHPRAVGLAVELFGRWEGAVVPIASLRREDDLVLAFRHFLSGAEDQRKALEKAVPLRKEQSRLWDPTILER